MMRLLDVHPEFALVQVGNEDPVPALGGDALRLRGDVLGDPHHSWSTITAGAVFSPRSYPGTAASPKVIFSMTTISARARRAVRHASRRTVRRRRADVDGGLLLTDNPREFAFGRRTPTRGAHSRYARPRTRACTPRRWRRSMTPDLLASLRARRRPPRAPNPEPVRSPPEPRTPARVSRENSSPSSSAARPPPSASTFTARRCAAAATRTPTTTGGARWTRAWRTRSVITSASTACDG